MNYEKKTELTKKQLKEALIKLLNEENFEKITISELTHEALVTRSTFYRYYDDKYELLSEIENEMIDFIKNGRIQTIEERGHDNMFTIESVEDLFKSLESKSNIIKGLLVNEGVFSFEMKLKKTIDERLTFIQGKKNQSTAKFELAKNYLLSLFITTFKYWAVHREDTDIKEISQFVLDVYKYGVIKAAGLDK